MNIEETTVSEARPRSGAAPEARLAPSRVVTATALFDGHDASINLIRRLLQECGAEVVHLGHNRPVHEIVRAAVQEDAQAVAVSSYQGGHNEFFRFLRESLDRAGRDDLPVFGGGGGVILPSEVQALAKQGVVRIFTPEDGRQLGLRGMAEAILEEARRTFVAFTPPREVSRQDERGVARALTWVERGRLDELPALSAPAGRAAHVIGVTGPGGAGKSSLVDELVLRLGRDFAELPVAVLSVDPTKRRTGGALLGDRLRMNAVYRDGVFMRSLATRRSGDELSPAVEAAVQILRGAGFDLIIIETAGTGQGSSAILDIADTSVYVMTPEFGAPTQLEKIDMLDFADLVAVNKLDRRAAEDAVGSVARQLRRVGREAGEDTVIGTCGQQYDDPGVETLYRNLVQRVAERGGPVSPEVFRGLELSGHRSTRVVPPERENYLAAAAAAVRDYHEETRRDVAATRTIEALEEALEVLDERSDENLAAARRRLEERLESSRHALSPHARALLESWPAVREQYRGEEIAYRVRDREIRVSTRTRSLSDLSIPRVAMPRYESRADILRFLREENVPGAFPYTAGVFPFRRSDEHPTRQFAGEGPPERTNRRFHLLAAGHASTRLSTAFDSVTLYGHDPDERPDIYGKVGESGVSVATLEDMKRLYAGFDLCDPSTSVSMTINGPAPIILAMFFNTAIDQQLDRFRSETGREPDDAELERLRTETLRSVRGTVQADILKEDQAQNTCIFSTPFALRLMGDVQEYFVEHGVRNFYSVSISGYHIAEAGANPISQLAFTLANGLTYVEYYLSRGLKIDDFAPNLSFFFSMGLDPEYAVLGRVARRVWAIVLQRRYGASERGQRLKYHIQTSGRSLHAREVSFNDIRTTLQALLAHYDCCNSLHTNAYDEAVTTPTEESVRRAVAIQLIVQQELGLSLNENPNQGSFLIEELTELVEEAVLREFDRISSRGGVLGAMESGYLRGRIQEESRIYEETKHSGERPVIGVNTFVNESEVDEEIGKLPVVRATEEEKRRQIERLREFQEEHREAAKGELATLRDIAARGGNTFAALMDVTRSASLGQITAALFDVGGAYRRMM